VHRYLLTQGIPVAQIEWKAFGETRPVADNETEAGRQRNRRVECVVLK
jgi:outer membrane protein OmpA-like peptidoglycan-associated protein